MIDVVVTDPIPGQLAVDVEFDQDMNTGVLPALGTFTITSDGTPLACTPTAWSTVRKLNLLTTGNSPVVTGFIRQNILDVNCYSALGTFSRPQPDLQWFP